MTYLGGHSARKGLLGILAFPVDYSADAEFTMFYTTFGDQWFQLQFDFDVASLTYLRLPAEAYKGWWLAGKRGEVVEIVGGNLRVESIPTAGTGASDTHYGYLSQIRTIAGELFICGYRRQVYRRAARGWELISQGILDARKVGPWTGFESIDGFSGRDIYAVGDGGEIWAYDGTAWSQCDSPTNQNLSEVRCLNGKVWIGGAGGIILCGDKQGWDVVWHGDDPAENWWSIESFQGRIYVAGDDFLGTIDEGVIVPVNVPIKAGITTGTLHEKEGILWSIGEEDILAFDGTSWTELVCPENR
jgi:hypothetical protein